APGDRPGRLLARACATIGSPQIRPADIVRLTVQFARERSGVHRPRKQASEPGDREPGAVQMATERREFLALVGAAIIAPLAGKMTDTRTPAKEPMYGLIGKIKTVAGQRDALAAILLGGTGSMPGCLSYVVASDPKDPDALWVTEVWDSPESHQASLKLPAVQAAITKGRPLIAGFSDHV